MEPIVISEDGGVLKVILRQGYSDMMPEEGQLIHVHYEGKLESGEVFDSSYPRKDPLKFNIGEGQVIKGWDMGLATMKLGEKALLTI